MPEGDRFGYFDPFVPLVSGMTFYLMIYSGRWISKRLYRPLQLLGKLTLPAYLMHDFIIRIYMNILWKEHNPGLVLGIFTSIIAFLTCMLFSWVLSLLPFTAQWLCGWRMKANRNLNHEASVHS